MPQSALLKQAAAHISENLAEHPEKKLAEIIDEAAMRFNLSPLDSQALTRLFSETEQDTRE
ncbi:hypothetical protein LJC09_00745 [Desulfovibrio sp. OttesenSCG-928-F20]|nr:hypothetical protein [Desulfovibrio sp. OttesenSCG-928-F20]